MDNADDVPAEEMKKFSSYFSGHLKDAYVKGLMTGSRDTFKSILFGIDNGERNGLSAEKVLEQVKQNDIEWFLKYMLDEEYFKEEVED
jgi:hypothetical protein